MDEETSSVICGLIAGVLTADHHMHVHEADFLRRMRGRFGIMPGTPIAPVSDVDQAVSKLGALPEELRKQTFGLLIEAAAADGKIAPEEQSFLTAMAKTLGVDEANLDERLQQQIATSKPQPFGLAAKDEND